MKVILVAALALYVSFGMFVCDDPPNQNAANRAAVAANVSSNSNAAANANTITASGNAAGTSNANGGSITGNSAGTGGAVSGGGNTAGPDSGNLAPVFTPRP